MIIDDDDDDDLAISSASVHCSYLSLLVWKAVVDVPRNLQRVVIILQSVVDISQ